MDPAVALITTLIATVVVASHVVFVAVVYLLVTKTARERASDTVLHFLANHSLLIAMVAALGSLIGSLWYSEVVGFPVCKYCWLARTMMYPLAVLLLIAWHRHDLAVWRYATPLAALGFAISVWHYLVQKFAIIGAACSTAPGDVPCTTQLINEYGYVTFPMFGITVCAWILLMMLLVREQEKVEAASDPLRTWLHRKVDALLGGSR